MMTLKIALRNVFRHKARSIVTLSTIAFGCVAMIYVGGYFEDVLWQMREAYIGSQLGHIQLYCKGYKEHGRVDPYRYLIPNPEEIKAIVKKFPEVSYATSRFLFSGLVSTGENSITFIGEGIEPENELMVPMFEAQDLRKFMKTARANWPLIDEGESLKPGDDFHLVLGQGLAKTMKAKINTPITVLTNTVHGATNALDLNIKGTFQTAMKDYDDVYLRMPMKTAQSLLDTKSAQSIVIKLNKTEDTELVSRRLQEMFWDQHLNLELRRWNDLADFYNKTVALFKMFYLIMRIVTCVVVILGIFNTLNMSVMERISEIGTIMALGSRRFGVLKLFLYEGLILGFIGGIIGMLAGAVIVSLIAAIGIEMPPPPGGTFSWLSMPKVVPHIVFTSFAMSVIVGAVSSLYPAIKASRMVITEALRYR